MRPFLFLFAYMLFVLVMRVNSFLKKKEFTTALITSFKLLLSLYRIGSVFSHYSGQICMTDSLLRLLLLPPSCLFVSTSKEKNHQENNCDSNIRILLY